MARKKKKSKSVDAFTHGDASRKNIPTAEHESVLAPEHEKVKELQYLRNTDLDPQLVWRGKDEKDWSDLVVPAPPLYIQEKVHPKVLIDDLMRTSESDEDDEDQVDLFGDFNGIPEGADKTDFYAHDQNWSNRMILGDSLQVMASLAEREGLRGKVQCIYFDPPYGIKFNSNFQWSTTSRDVKDGKADHITREPEQVKAFRDTWRDGIHSYLGYLRDRLTVARDLLHNSGSLFFQIGDENVHLVRSLLDEVFGSENFVSEIVLKTTSGAGSPSGGTLSLASVHDYVIWYARDRERLKYRQLFTDKADMSTADLYRRVSLATGVDRVASEEELSGASKLPKGADLFRPDNLTSQSSPDSATFAVDFRGLKIRPGKGGWKTNQEGMQRLIAADRIYMTRNHTLQYVRKWNDFAVTPINDVWTDVGTGSFTADKVYVVQTNEKIVSRCILMATDPGDLVLDPTCGSGTTAATAEHWGRRWITIDTSRVALALARSRVMGGRYPYFLLRDSPEGQRREAELSRSPVSQRPTHDDLRLGFVYKRAPHIMLRDIARNSEIDVIKTEYDQRMQTILDAINHRAQTDLDDWQVPLHPGDPWPRAARKQHKRFMKVSTDATRQKAVDRINEIMGRDYTIATLPETPVDDWRDPELMDLHSEWWRLRVERRREIEASIAARGEYEDLGDRPFEDPSTIRVAGPFTVESLSPHRTLGVDESDELIDPREVREAPSDYPHLPEFGHMVLQNLQTAGVQQAHKEDRIEFSSLRGWPGEFICAEGRYKEGASEKRAGIFIGPEFGTVRRSDLVDAAREAGDADFDVVISCAFNYEPHASEFNQLGRIPVLKARMNADLHMADDLKNTGSGNLFVIFGEPDIDLIDAEDDSVRVKINGVDVFDPSTGEVRSDGADGIACWFIDTDYNGESFFVRHAYFLGANDPYKSLKTTLKAEIDAEAWGTLNSDTSRPFSKPETGRVAVKVINHLGDEVMKVFRVA